MIEFVVQNEIKKISVLVKAGTNETIVELLSYLKGTLVKDLVISAHGHCTKNEIYHEVFLQ